MSTLHSLSASHWIDAIIFAAAVVFTVVSLERFREWLERGPDIARVRRVAILLVIAFYILAIAGVADFAIAGRFNLLNLGLFLNGAAGLIILTTLMLRNRRGREHRRMAAHDL